MVAIFGGTAVVGVVGGGGLFAVVVRALFLCLVPSFFRHEDLQTALSCYQKGNELAAKGEYKQATRHYHRGIHVSRPVVVELNENHDLPQLREDDPKSALEFLTQTYVASSQAHLQLGDLDAARKDAWAACLVSNNSFKAGLECMLDVATVAGDRIGELSTLKLLLEQTKDEQRRQNESVNQDHDGLGSGGSKDDDVFCDEDMVVIQLSRRIAEVQRFLDRQLEERMGKKIKDQGDDPLLE